MSGSGEREEPASVYRVGASEAGERLDRFLCSKIPKLSRARVQRAIDTRVSIDWADAPKASTRVVAGGVVRVGYEPLDEPELDVDIPVLGQGADWLAVDKPAGIPVHPDNRVRANSLIRVVRRRLGDDRWTLVHRLDRETSGVLMLARTACAARVLSRAFAHGAVKKTYVALVEGVPEASSGHIDAPIGDDPDSAVYVRQRVDATGRPAVTRWRRRSIGPRRALLEVIPETGRKHQIRVHLEAIGHPVVGDLLYGRGDDGYLERVRTGFDSRKDAIGLDRHLLHAGSLEFRMFGERVRVVSPVPDLFDRHLKS